MKKRYNLLVSFLVCVITLGALFTSCSEETDCSMTVRSYAVCNFYKYGATKDIILEEKIPTLTVTVLGTDSVLLNRDTDVHTWNQPLRYTEETTTFILTYGDPDSAEALRDTIVLAHENTSFFVSVECGYQVIQNITRVVSFTTNQIDNVILTNPEANSNDRENIKIIF